MKIMHLISGGDVGGAKTHVLSLLEGLNKTEDVRLVCFMDGPFAQEARELGIPVRILKHKNVFSLRKEIIQCVRNGGYELLPEEKLAYDMEYINKRGLWLDFVCILQTVRLIFTHEGAR